MKVPHEEPDRAALDAGAQVRRGDVLVTCTGVVPTPAREQVEDPYFYERSLLHESSCASVQSFRAPDVSETLNLRIFLAGILVAAGVGILLEALITGRIAKDHDEPGPSVA
jgi:hypothetical protein